MKFNAKKSNLIIFKCDSNSPPDPSIDMNGDRIKLVRQAICWGHLLNDCIIYDYDTSKCTNDFNRLCNMFFADFKNASSYIRNFLFSEY